MEIATQGRAGLTEIAFSLTPQEHEALLGERDEGYVRIVGDGLTGIRFLPERQRGGRNVRHVKPLEITKKQPYRSRVWVRPDLIGLTMEKMGRLRLTAEIKPGEYVVTPPIYKTWLARQDAPPLPPEAAPPTPAPPTVEPSDEEIRRPGINGVERPTDPHVIGGGKVNFGRLLGLARELNRARRLCLDSGVMVEFTLDAKGRLNVRRDYKQHDEED